MQYIWTVFNRNTHTCDKDAIKIDERENSQDNLIETISFVTQKNSQEQNLFLMAYTAPTQSPDLAILACEQLSLSTFSRRCIVKSFYQNKK